MQVGCAGTVDESDGETWALFTADARVTLPLRRLRRCGTGLTAAVEKLCAETPRPISLRERIALSVPKDLLTRRALNPFDFRNRHLAGLDRFITRLAG